MTEFKWYEGPIIHKLYLSAILDLCDRRIVSYVIRDRNDNKLVFDTLDKAVLEIQMLTHCSTVTVDSSTPAELSTRSCWMPE